MNQPECWLVEVVIHPTLTEHRVDQVRDVSHCVVPAARRDKVWAAGEIDALHKDVGVGVFLSEDIRTADVVDLQQRADSTGTCGGDLPVLKRHAESRHPVQA